MRLPIQFIFSDGKSCFTDVERGEALLAATRAAGMDLLVDCEEGVCGTCQAQVSCGAVGMTPFTEGLLSPAEIKDGAVLMCRALAEGPAVIELPYSSTDAQVRDDESAIAAVVTSVEATAKDTLTLTVHAERTVEFLPGQYSNLSPASGIERSFSMANAPGTDALVFHIALRPNGQFSDWLKSAAPGAPLRISPPRGTFFLRDESRPKVMIAGGTGLAPMLSMLRVMALSTSTQPPAPVTLLVGARSDAHLFELATLDSLRQQLPALDVNFACDEVSEGSGTAQGRVTTLLEEMALPPEAAVYACGPPPMIEAIRQILKSRKFPMKRFLFEKFTG